MTVGPGPITASLTADHQAMEPLILEAEKALASAVAGAAFTALDRLWMRLAVHIRAEHKGVFPALGSARPDLMDELGTLRQDHDFFMATLAVVVRGMESPAPDFAKAGAMLEAVRTRLVSHNALEEGVIYMMADQLPPDACGQVVEVIARELAFLPGRYRS